MFGLFWSRTPHGSKLFRVRVLGAGQRNASPDLRIAIVVRFLRRLGPHTVRSRIVFFRINTDCSPPRDPNQCRSTTASSISSWASYPSPRTFDVKGEYETENIDGIPLHLRRHRIFKPIPAVLSTNLPSQIDNATLVNDVPIQPPAPSIPLLTKPTFNPRVQPRAVPRTKAGPYRRRSRLWVWNHGTEAKLQGKMRWRCTYCLVYRCDFSQTIESHLFDNHLDEKEVLKVANQRGIGSRKAK
ncbi:hypothetical protein K440DRAFT_681329 [Wilcoxina mikolae CBS 423.85]|nr:hypothetical protein K440DRAFT_681329 [Wilcoxina mikolae CBS 423.85]